MTSDNNIQRYKNLINGDEIVRNDNGHLVKYKDHLKAMEASQFEIERQDGQLTEYTSLLNEQYQTIEAQAKEIERLRSENQEMELFMRTHS